MKKGWKIFWIICGGCAGVGLICCVAALIMGVTVEAIEDRFPYGFSFPFRTRHSVNIVSDDDYEDYDDYDDDVYDDDDYDDDTHHHNGVSIIEGDDMQTFQNVRSIDMYVCAGYVEVRYDEDTAAEITVEAENIDRRLELRYYMEGDELKIKTKKKVVHVNNAGKIYINIPKDFKLEEADLELLAGSLYVEDINAGKLSVDVGAGEAAIDKFNADEADFNCGTGSLITAGNVNKEADIECGIGQITFTASGRQSDYNYKFTCGIGKVNCGGDTYSGLGSEKKVNNHASKEMDIECGIGEVNVYFSDEL